MKKAFIIAEAGVNHNGKISLAKKLIDKAKISGADAIKFQTFLPEELTTKMVKTAKYQAKSGITQQKLLSNLSLNFKEFVKLKNYCKKKKIVFLSSGFDLDSLKFLIKLNLKFEFPYDFILCGKKITFVNLFYLKQILLIILVH